MIKKVLIAMVIFSVALVILRQSLLRGKGKAKLAAVDSQNQLPTPSSTKEVGKEFSFVLSDKGT